MSSRKDRVRLVGINRVPAQFSASPAEFQKKCDAFLDTALTIPIVKNNILKVDMVCSYVQPDVALSLLFSMIRWYRTINWTRISRH